MDLAKDFEFDDNSDNYNKMVKKLLPYKKSRIEAINYLISNANKAFT